MCRYLPATFVQTFTASETEIGVMQWDLPSTGFNTGWYQDIYNSLLELNREVHHCKKSASRKLSWISLFPVKAGIIGEWKSYPIPIPGCSNHNMRSLTVLLPPWCVCCVCVCVCFPWWMWWHQVFFCLNSICVVRIELEEVIAWEWV